MDAILNVGLRRNDGGGDLVVEVVEDVLADMGLEPVAFRNDATGEEPTLVAHCLSVTPAQLYAACHVLAQDCIAVYDLKRCVGELVGPKAKEWGRFDPQYFRVL